MIRGNILTIGFSAIDFQIAPPCRSENGKKVFESNEYSFSAGGRGANTAIAAARLGWGSLLCTALGSDMFGRIFTQIFQDERVDFKYIKNCRTSQTAMDILLKKNDTTPSKIVIPAACRFIGATDVEAAFDVIPDAVITSLEIPVDAVSVAAHGARTQNALFVLDTTGTYKDIDISSIKSANVVITSDEDISTLTGVTIKSMDDRMNACIKLNSIIEAEYTIIDMEDKGFYIYDGKYCKCILPYDVGVVERNGAREAFTAALTIEFMRTDDMESALQFAAAAHALASGEKGSFESIPTEGKIRELMRSSGNE